MKTKNKNSNVIFLLFIVFSYLCGKEDEIMDELDNAKVFVVTFPLKTEPWQEDRINKMLRMLTVHYNNKQEILVSRYRHLSHSDEFHEAKKGGLSEFRKFMSSHGFTKFDIEKVFADSSKSNSVTNEQMLCHGLNSMIIQEQSHRAWSAWEKRLYGTGKFVRTETEVTSFKSRKCKNVITGFQYSLTDFTVTMTAQKPHRHVMFTIPFEVNKNSEYELFALHQEIRNIAIVRKEVRGRQKFYVQFSFAGVPYNKCRCIGQGVVGIDPGPGKIAIVSDDMVAVKPLATNISEDERMVARLRRRLDRSRRATNPQMYNADGTTKRGERQKVFSNHYIRTRAELADHQRKLAAKRKIAHNELANELLSLGNEFRVEKNSFRSMQSRSKKSEKTASGKNRSKKRFGKSLKNHAPSEFLTILENKVRQYSDGVFVDIPASTACTQFDFTNGEFTKHELQERTIVTSDGIRHDRDALAAFNMKHVNVSRITGKKKIEKDKENFDTDSMQMAYGHFCEMEQRINRDL